MLKTEKTSIGSSQKLKGQKKAKPIDIPKEKNGDIIKCIIDDEEYELEIGERYDFPDENGKTKESVFRGTYSSESSKLGYYYNPETKNFFELKDDPEVNLEMISEVSEEDLKDRKTAFLNTGEKKRRSKQNRDEVLRFEIEPANDIMVKLIKERINKSSITSRDVMVKTTSGSNMIAGLRSRNSMTLQTFYIWCKILGCTPIISIKD